MCPWNPYDMKICIFSLSVKIQSLRICGSPHVGIMPPASGRHLVFSVFGSARERKRDGILATGPLAIVPHIAIAANR